MVRQFHDITDRDIEDLASRIRGPILKPGNGDYETTRRVWNGMINRHPSLIVQCTGTADVAATVAFTRDHDLPLAIRGGGHNVAGTAVCDDGVVADLRLMKGIQIDAENRRVRVQGGATWGDLDHETQAHGLIVPGGVVSTTGVAGLTLSGGMGATRRKWGLSCDSLIGAEVVTADASMINVDDSSHPDLLWALRGGGGNFGVVTTFEFELHPHGPECYQAAPIYLLEDAHQVIPAWRDYVVSAPDEVTSDIIFWSMPPLPGVDPKLVGHPIMIVAGWYIGSAEDAEAEIQRFRELSEPGFDLSHVGRYVDQQRAFDPFFPDTQRYYWKSLFIDQLTDDVIDQIIEIAFDRPSPQSLMALRVLGGAIARVPEATTSYGNRKANFNLSLDTTWLNAEDDDQMIAWTRNSWDRLHELTGGGVYLNFAGLGEDAAALNQSAYGSNLDRLIEIKQRYDPENRFRSNINIVPSSPA
jgi:FAD/FMN-containing dehydrogenase